MDTSSNVTRKSHASPELEKFNLYFELVPVKKLDDRTKQSRASNT